MNKNEIKYDALDGIRAYFVILTFLVHYIPNITGFGHPTTVGKILQWFQQSNYGVYGFFILSGFLIGRMWMGAHKRTFLDFLWKRFLRIYPAFFVSTLISAIIGIYYTRYMPWGWDLKKIAENLVFFNGWFSYGEVASYNFVTWSLFYEFLFYIIVIFIIIGLRIAKTNSIFVNIFVAYIVFIITCYVMSMDAPFYLFLAGWVIAAFSDEKLKVLAQAMPEKLLIFCYIFTTSAYSLNLMSKDIFIFMFMIMSSLLIIRSNYADGILSQIFKSSLMRKLGKISYSFYLLHSTIIITYFFTFQKLFPNASSVVLKLFPIISLPIVFALTTVASIILYNLTERFYFKQQPIKFDIFKDFFQMSIWKYCFDAIKKAMGLIRRYHLHANDTEHFKSPLPATITLLKREYTVPHTIRKYPLIFAALALIFISFPDVILGNRSLMVTEAAPFDGSSAYVKSNGREKIHSLYYENKKNTVKGYFDAGGTIWQSESKIPFMKYALKKTESPFWNPFQGAGTLGSETLVDIKFSPLTITAALLGGSSLAYNFVILLFLTISSYCLIKLCVTLLELPLIAGMAAAIAFIFNGFQASGLAMNYSQSYLLFPIVLYGLCSWVKFGGIFRFILAYFSCALVLCLTFIPTTFLTILTIFLIAVAYVFQQPYSKKLKLFKIIGLGFTALCGLLLTAVIYLPIVDSFRINNELSAYSERVFFPVTLNGLLSIFSPKHLWSSYVTMNSELLSDHASQYYVANNALFHIGIVGGLIALFSLQKNLFQRPILLCAWVIFSLILLRVFGIALYPHPENTVFVGNIFLRGILLIGLGACVLSQKEHWKKLAFIPLWIIAGLITLRLLGLNYYDVIFSKLPIIGNFATQYMWTSVMVCLPILVAYGFGNMVQNFDIVRRVKYFLLLIFVLLASLLPNYPFEIMSKQNMVHLVAFAVFCYAIYYLYKKQVSGAGLKYLPLIVLSLLFVEYNYYMNHARTERSKLYRHMPDYVAFVKENIGNNRILNIGQIGLPAEQASAYQIQDISTMTNSAPPDYINFYLKYLVPKEYRFFDVLTNLQAKDTAQINLNMVSFMGVKYILVQKDWPVWNTFLEERLKPAFSSSAISVYENKDAWPRAFFTSEQLENLVPENIENGLVKKENIIAAEFIEYHNSYIGINIEAPSEGTLVLTDNWYPYWRAYVNHKEVPVNKVFGAFRGVSVPSGKSVVEFSYQNPAVYYGKRISSAMLLATVIFAAIAFLRFAFDSKVRSAKNQRLTRQPKTQGL